MTQVMRIVPAAARICGYALDAIADKNPALSYYCSDADLAMLNPVSQAIFGLDVPMVFAQLVAGEVPTVTYTNRNITGFYYMECPRMLEEARAAVRANTSEEEYQRVFKNPDDLTVMYDNDSVKYIFGAEHYNRDHTDIITTCVIFNADCDANYDRLYEVAPFDYSIARKLGFLDALTIESMVNETALHARIEKKENG